MTPDALRELIITECRRLGFHRIGIVPIEPPARYDAYLEWVEAGHHGSMAYMAAPDHVAGRKDLLALADSARFVIVVALAYAKTGGVTEGGLRGFVARYARGADYHLVMKRKLRELADAISSAVGDVVAARACVDTAPVLERELAERAGVGFVAKNTMLIAPGLGSYVVLGELLVDADVAPTATEREDSRCGSCRACLDACPTGAFAGAYVLDARKCISYLTIEHRGWIPRDLRQPMGTMVFGCDICQEVCPWNTRGLREVPADTHGLRARVSPRPHWIRPTLEWILQLTQDSWRREVRGTALRRAKYQGLLRNALVAAGNSGDAALLPLLEQHATGSDAMLAEHARWAIERLKAAALAPT